MARHFTFTQKAFDKIARIVCKEKQAEIDALKAYIESLGKEGRILSMKYSQLGGYRGEPLDDLPHEVFDFLQAI